MLAEYRHRSLVQGHTGFGWLRGPAAVAPILLETPTRIRALGLVFVVALMVRNFVQYRLRTAMKQQSKPVAHPLRRTRLVNNLTAGMAMVWIDGVRTGALRTGEGPWKRQPKKVPDPTLEILTLLKVDPRALAHPQRR